MNRFEAWLNKGPGWLFALKIVAIFVVPAVVTGWAGGSILATSLVGE